jgi:hypothetical protein
MNNQPKPASMADRESIDRMYEEHADQIQPRKPASVAEIVERAADEAYSACGSPVSAPWLKDCKAEVVGIITRAVEEAYALGAEKTLEAVKPWLHQHHP